MPVRKLMIALCVAASAAVALAQSAAPPPAAPPQVPAVQQAAPPAAASSKQDGGEPTFIRPETPQQRKERLGTAEDPGPDPDPSKHFWRFGHSFHLERYERRWASYDSTEPGWVKPFAFVNVQKELYQQNEKWVWVWMQDFSPEEVAEMSTVKPTSRFTDEQVGYYKRVRSEFFETSPKQNDVVVRFEESSQGLPTSGSWRNSGTVADMNGDGCPDILAPPERGGINVPAIFLGDCKGHWKYWAEARWPHGVDYGNVVAADFNKDGKMDVAFGVHLTGIYLFLGDGKGNFTESDEGLPKAFPTRRIVVADVDGDGYPDIVGLSEGPTSPRQQVGSVKHIPGRIRVYFNRKKGTLWEGLEVAGNDVPVAGDWLSIGHFNGDKVPDFLAATIFFNSTSTIFLSSAPKKWKPLVDKDGNLIPSLSYYFASAAGKFTSAKRDDAIVSYIRSWPSDLDETVLSAPPAKMVAGIDRISFAGEKPTRTPIVRWGSNRGVWGLGAGDFDHDGKLDFMYTRYDPREAVLMLGDGKGGFTRAKVEGLTLAPNTNYDVLVADVNNDGLPDVIMMYESATKGAFSSRDGSIHVFLNRGAAKVDATRKTATTK